MSEEEALLKSLKIIYLGHINRVILHTKILYSNQFLLVSNKERLENIQDNLKEGHPKIYTNKEAELLLLHYVIHDIKPQRVKDIDMI